MDKYFKDKIALITGASSGIGEALVYAFISNGCRVIAASIDKDGLDRVAKNCEGLAGSIRPIVFDLSDTPSIEPLIESLIKEEKHIDILLNIGGVSQRATILDTPLWLDRKIMEINYFGTIALTKAVLPYMISNGGGQIAATSSITGRFGFPLRSAYSASKQALHGFFETLIIEYKKDNIKASVLIPGRVRTSISVHALTSTGEEHGKMDAGQAGGITPEKAARMIINGLKRNKREILVGSKELLMLKIRKYFPSLFFRLAGRIKSM